MLAVHTDQKVDKTTEDDRGDGAQGDVGQDLGEEVDGHSVVAADVLVSVAQKPGQKSNSISVCTVQTDTEVTTPAWKITVHT